MTRGAPGVHRPGDKLARGAVCIHHDTEAGRFTRRVDRVERRRG